MRRYPDLRPGCGGGSRDGDSGGSGCRRAGVSILSTDSISLPRNPRLRGIGNPSHQWGGNGNRLLLAGGGSRYSALGNPVERDHFVATVGAVLLDDNLNG